ncbi:hypothetical protein GAYE_SCF43G5683 [Galdieria yellowstonensis]|uniref:protein disulfide-isomerase n=1 Tax=Galdieria yellowstonensis TaxID=3028027 RepID=A0AAV9IJT0_9RHOD|nr:hypothetical protein GAYE_SCF43G5683 [Galdieria yellowstonensis]
MVCWITRIEAQENNNQSHVVQLTSENFWSVVQNEPCVFVKFYAPWCSHCNKMAKDFEKAAEELVGKAVFAEVDSTQEKELSDELKIEGYPTLKLFIHGQFEKDYYGKRKAKDMISFVRGSITSPWKLVANESDAVQLEQLVREKRNGCLLVAYSKDAEFRLVLDRVSKPISVAVDGMNMFYLTSNATLWKTICERYGVDANEAHEYAILSIRYFNEELSDHPNPLIHQWNSNQKRSSDNLGDWMKTEQVEDLSRFVRGSVLPPLSYINSTSVQQFKATKLPILIAFIKNISQMDPQLVQVLETVSKDMLGYVNVALGDWNSLGSLRRQLYVSDNESDSSAIVMHVFEKNKNYVFPRKSTAPKVKQLKRWIQGVLDGTVEEFRRSEKPPMPNKGIPKLVVGETWHSIVEDPKRDVFILQYAHWLEKSREAEAIVDDIAKELSSDKLIIAKMNAVDNDAPSPYFANKYPTMHYFPAGSPKVGIPFDSPVTRENIYNFIKQHASFPLENKKEEL